MAGREAAEDASLTHIGRFSDFRKIPNSDVYLKTKDCEHTDDNEMVVHGWYSGDVGND